MLKLLLRAVPGKKVLGGGTELENGATTNTILSFFYGTVHMDIPGNTPTHLILIDFSSTPNAVFPGTALNQKP